MTPATRQRLFGYEHAFDHPVTWVIAVTLVLLLVLTGVALPLLHHTGRTSDKLHRELWNRWKSWCWLLPAMIAPILMGAAWVMAAVFLLSLLCYREFARATRLFRERVVSIGVVASICAVTFAVVDHWKDDRLFFAVAPLGVAVIAAISIHLDKPRGYIQRTALGVLGFLLFGYSLGYLGNIANTGDIGNGTGYRPILLMLLVAVEMNDIFAFCSGKLIGGPKLLPATSPNKTVAGAAGAMLLTTVLVTVIGWFIFRDTAMHDVGRLVTLGVLISGTGQLGDLMLSSIKRDVDIKDMASVIPRHGGLLDRFDSLVLVPPAVYHYLSLYLGPLGAGEATRIITGVS